MKIRNYVLILIVMLSFGLLAETKLTKIPEIKYETLNINGNKNYEIVKPIFIDNVKFKEVNSEINKLIDKKTLEDEEKENCIADPERCGTYELIMEPVIEYQDKNIISLSINVYMYLGGAHGAYGTESFIINRKTGEIITDKILGTEKDAVLEKIYNYILKNSPEMYFSSDMISKKCVITDCPVFVKTGKDIVQIRYGIYSVAPYVAGEQVFEYNQKTKKLYYFNRFDGNDEKLEVK